MFKRIYAMFLTVILALSLTVTGICYVSMRSYRINDRLKQLTEDAREIAWIAGQSTASSFVSFNDWFRGGYSSPYSLYLNHKALEIHEEYGAYIALVDRYGHVMDNMQLAYADNPEFATSVDTEKVSESLQQVLGGEEISVRSDDEDGATFIVGVPFVMEGRTLGAVFIQTDAQQIESGIEELAMQLAMVALAAMAIAALCTLLYTRSALRPLRQVTSAANAMANGQFGQHADESRGAPEMRRLAHAFNTMADQLERTEISRREFVANVSHELRSPMTSISGFVQGMLDDTIPQEEHPKYLGIVYSETQRLTKLVGELLNLSRLERDDATLKLTDFDICELLCRALIRRETDLTKRHIEVNCDFEDDCMMVHADLDRIEQVAINLLDNAIRFTPEGGEITLKCVAAKAKCSISVIDNGPGVPPEDRNRVFERFFTADRAHTAGKGTGLGLSICQRIMQMHGETITLDDTSNGASFTFTLPLSAGTKKGL